MHLTGGNSNTFNPIAPTNNSSPNTCSSLTINSKKHLNSTTKCDSSFAQHVDSSRNINKNSLTLNITSKTCDALLGGVAQQQPQQQQQQKQSQNAMNDGINDENAELTLSPKCDATSPTPPHSSQQSKKSVKRNFSMLSFKSLDFNLRSICSSMKGKNAGKDTNSSGSGKSTTVPTASSSKTSITTTTRAPYLKVEGVEIVGNDIDEEHLLISFPQSPYSHRGSFDKTQSQHLTTIQSDYSRSQASSPYLSITTPPNIRRSSTSDIIDKKPAMPSTNPTPNESRRPSTSSLLRRARERKGSETKGGRHFH